MLELTYNNKVSFVQGPAESLVLVAVQLEPSGKSVLTWFDPAYQRAFVVKRVVKDEPDALDFDTEEGRFRLRPMTLALYRKHVRPVTHGPPFPTQQAMERFFLDNWGMG